MSTSTQTDQHTSKIEYSDLPDSGDKLETALKDNGSDTAAVVTDTTEVTDTVPEKYKDKTVTEVITMHQNAESTIARQGTELGTLRTLTDQALSLKRTEDLIKGGQPEDVEITSDDILSKPKEVVTKVAEDVVGPVSDRLDAMEGRLAMRDFASRHATYQTDVQDPKFKEHVASSAYRVGLAKKAEGGDMMAADELFTSWDEVKAADAALETDENDTQETAATLRAAKLVEGSSDTSAVNNKPIYRREDLMNMQMNDRESYDDPRFQQLLTVAYKEGRVK